MSESGSAGGQSSTGDPTDGTRAAVEFFVGRNQLQFGYLMLAVLLAGVWWMAAGPISAWIAGLGLVVLAFNAQAAVTAVLSRRWPTADGVVVSSEVLTEPEAREYAGLDPVEGAEDTGEFSGGYIPVVRYEFTVDGRRYENAAISPFDDTLSRRGWAEALVGEYAEHSPVSVRYDPDDPTRSYLRPVIRSSKVMTSAIGFVMLAGASWFVVGMPGGAPVVPLAFGLPAVFYGLSGLVTDLHSRRWPTTTGTVTATGTNKETGSARGEGTKTIYVPGLQYEYTVDGTSYVSTRYALVGGEPTFDTRDEALAWIEDNHPMDSDVAVHYDPDRPGRAVLVPGGARRLGVLLGGLVFVGIGVFLLLYPSASAL